jgi:predicted transcriptional regulator
MHLQDYINNSIKPLHLKDSIYMAQETLNDFHNSHIPVIKDNIYLGVLSENEAGSYKPEKSIEDIKHELEHFYVNENADWLLVLESLVKNNSDFMPVINEKGEYLGYYELSDIITFFNRIPFLNEHGAIIKIKKESADYSFSEISQIIETNNLKPLGIFISDSEGAFTEITLKINSSDTNSLLQTFRRYDYEVVSDSNDDKYLEDLKERSDYLIKYLNL